VVKKEAKALVNPFKAAKRALPSKKLWLDFVVPKEEVPPAAEEAGSSKAAKKPKAGGKKKKSATEEGENPEGDLDLEEGKGKVKTLELVWKAVWNVSSSWFFRNFLIQSDFFFLSTLSDPIRIHSGSVPSLAGPEGTVWPMRPMRPSRITRRAG
jgi:hypothetical protein